MRHGKDFKKLGRTASHRRALLSNLVGALIKHKRVTTTLDKAKEARRFADRAVTFGKKGTVAARRHVYKFIPKRHLIKILFDEIAPHFQNRDGGYTRVVKLGRRKGDNAELAILEFVGFEDMQLEKAHKAKERRAERKRRKEEVEKAAAEEEQRAAAEAEAAAAAESEKTK